MKNKELIQKIKECKALRAGWKNLKGAYISYNEYVSENLSNVLVGESIQESISYSEYLSEKIK
jgi:hypothetical protein